ncbi:malto-oligosyltrehalose trehalohydrolase [Pseudoclavibacter endophyticus]|uniref:malto-oligosyltrehalose trehalohydrolase n=1 Tax=Pseudoclavibacter endophyticus TaxID=1778590 RepID=UPI0016636DB0|nr:malto-oligosyltrehalose trehalohydrolase [Pseudoclavibacter endophyticus]GGA76485.1 malto-oligosyltrehalose trehalohydrolase [Pseudoclavibacter endophyticus]
MRREIPFDVWAPRASSVELVLDPGDRNIVVPMRAAGGGWFSPERHAALDEPELDFGYRIDGSDALVPSPTSRRLPHGVHGPSRTFDATSFEWTDRDWRGRRLAGGVIYELHIGTFTQEGTLDAAAQRLGELVDLGVDFVELMPVNAFNGAEGWGYDGVAWYAVHEAYGGPRAYQRFVNACHERGLGVVQDVVYNHLGPSGNYLGQFGPYLQSGTSTGWGELVNLDGPDSDEVRRYILDNAAMWFDDYHVDALRLDAVHALRDTRATHVLEELARETEVRSVGLGRPLSLIAESDLNDPRMITPVTAGGLGIDAQWADDFHHAVHAAITGERSGYYEDFAEHGLASVAKVLERGFFHDGTLSTFRERHHGRPLPDATATWRLVTCIQNHDQVGNRAAGDRFGQTLSDDQLIVAAALLLTAPFTPMLFMGEEWGAATPFPFFSSHPEPELGEAVSAGRAREFERMGWDHDAVPDPQARATFESARLDWSERSTARGARVLHAYRDLIRLRRELPDLVDPRLSARRAVVDEQARTLVLAAGQVRAAFNLSDEPREVALEAGGADGADGPGDADGPSGLSLAWQSTGAVRITGADGRDARGPAARTLALPAWSAAVVTA